LSRIICEVLVTKKKETEKRRYGEDVVYSPLPRFADSGNQGLGLGVGRPLGVGTDLGVGVGLTVAVGVAVGGGVTVGVGVFVGVGVADGDAVGVGVGVAPWPPGNTRT
jgi:hypothetical protein